MENIVEAVTTATENLMGRRYAGFWIRFVAVLLDSIIFGIPLYIILHLLFPQTTIELGGQTLPMEAGASQFIKIIAGVAYTAYFQSGKWQATIGKRIVGIYVIRSTGERISFMRAVGRYFAQILSMIILCIGYIMAGFTKEKTALHDLIADTRVVYGKR